MSINSSYQIVNNTTANPYAAVVYIIATFPDGQRLQGTGVVVGVNSVLTASHVVYSQDHGGAAVSAQVIPAYTGSASPYGSFTSAAIHYNAINDAKDLINSYDVQNDYAVIALKSPVGLQTGMFGFDPNFSSGNAYDTGYPATQSGHMTLSSGGTSLNHFSDGTTYLDDNNFYVSPGSSGGPIYEVVNGNPYVLGVVSTANWAAPINNASSANSYAQVLSDISSDHQYVASSLPTLNLANQVVPVGQGVTKSMSYQFSQSFTLSTTDTVTVASKDGTAKAGVDYDAYSGNASIAANGTTGNLTLNLHPNWSAHPDLTKLDFYLDFSNPLAAVFPNSYSGQEADITITRDGPVQAVQNGRMTEMFGNALANYTVQQGQNNSLTVSGQEGTFTFNNVDRLQFTDQTSAFDIGGSAGQAYRMYQAAFNRAPDAAGLGYWISQMDKGMSDPNVAARFIDSAEFHTLYGTSPTTKQFVDEVYNNVLHRAPDAGGEAFYIGQIDSGLKSTATVLADFAESSENQAQVIGTIQHGVHYTQWLG